MPLSPSNLTFGNLSQHVHEYTDNSKDEPVIAMGRSASNSSLISVEDESNTEHTLHLFQCLGEVVTVQTLLDALENQGLRQDDKRLQNVFESLTSQDLDSEITFPQFQSLIQSSHLMELALSERLVIPQFSEMCRKFAEIAEKAKEYRSPNASNNGLGANATVYN
jgi:hypothetical protein